MEPVRAPVREDAFPGTRRHTQVVGEDAVKDPALVRDLMSGLAIQRLKR